MTTSDLGPIAVRARSFCPRCTGTLEGSGERLTCRQCGKSTTVVVFAPLVDAAAAAPGTGRCAHHPNKDAVDGCGRCGSFVCDVCATRTGEQVLCPTCFDTMHERGDLATTNARRVRWDYLTLACGVCCCVPFCSVVATPAALVLGVVTLLKLRREPWLSPTRTIIGMTIALLGVGGFVAIMVLSGKR